MPDNKCRFVGERVSFSDVLRDASRGIAKIKQNEYRDSGSCRVVDQGNDSQALYCDVKKGICTDVPCLVFGDHTRCVKYIDEPFVRGADGVKVLTTLRADDNVRYWYHALRSARVPNLGYSRHFKLIKELCFADHAPDDQCRIASLLDAILRQVEICERKLSLLDQLVKSRFVEMFGMLQDNPNNWPIRDFGEFAVIDTRMTRDFGRYANVPHVGIDSIESGTGVLSGYRTVAEDGVKSGKYPFGPQHIIYSKIRPALNKVALPDFEGVCSADAYPILPNRKNCNRVFLAHVLRSEYFLDYILPLSGRAQMPKVNKEALKGFSIPLPPLALQQEFASFVSQVDKSQFVVRQQIEKLQTLYDSLAQEYFA